VYSVTEFKSLRSAEELLERIAQVKERKVQFVLAGNKCDLAKERQVARADAQDLAKKYNRPFIECCALTNQGIQDIFQTLGNLWIERPRDSAHSTKRRVRRRKVVRQGCCEIQSTVPLRFLSNRRSSKIEGRHRMSTGQVWRQLLEAEDAGDDPSGRAERGRDDREETGGRL
jgi:Fe2+ transport system protein B